MSFNTTTYAGSNTGQTHPDVTIVTPTPTQPAGVALNNNFSAIADALASIAAALATITTELTGTLVKANNLNDLANATTARTNLGLGTAATHASTDFASSSSLSSYLPLTGGTMTGSLSMGSHILTSSGTISGNVIASSTFEWGFQGYAVDLYSGNSPFTDSTDAIIMTSHLIGGDQNPLTIEMQTNNTYFADGTIGLLGDSSATFSNGKITLNADGSVSFANTKAFIGADGSAYFSNGNMDVDAPGNVTANSYNQINSTFAFNPDGSFFTDTNGIYSNGSGSLNVSGDLTGTSSVSGGWGNITNTGVSFDNGAITSDGGGNVRLNVLTTIATYYLPIDTDAFDGYAASDNTGAIVFSGGHFWGSDGSDWKQLDN